MTQPIQYETFGKMMFDHLPYILIGVVSLIGMTMLLLRKLGLLIFKHEKGDKGEICKHCEIFKDNGGSEVKVLKCDTHDLLSNAVKDIERRQNLMLQRQEGHRDALKNGKKEFKQIQDNIANLRVGVAVLLERSGGKVKEFSDIEIK